MEIKPVKVYLRSCPICGEKVNLCFYDDDAMRTYINYEDELSEFEDVYGFIHCHGCDADFCKTATLRELIEWWNDRIPINNIIKELEEKSNNLWLVRAERNGYKRAIEIIKDLA